MSGSNIDPVGEGTPNRPPGVEGEGCVDWGLLGFLKRLWAVGVGDEGDIDWG